MKNSSYYIAPVGDWTHDLPHTVASNMVNVSHALNLSATEYVLILMPVVMPVVRHMIYLSFMCACTFFNAIKQLSS